MKITLAKSDFFLIKKISADENINALNPSVKIHHIVLEGTKEQFQMVVEDITTELVANGLLDNFEPTKYGLLMESLIDLFYSIYE